MPKKRSVRLAVTPLAHMSVADLHREIRRRQRGTKALHRRRANLLAKIAALDAQILAAGGSLEEAVLQGRMGRTRPKNDTNLIDALRAVLKGKTMGVAEAAEAVQKAGYRTSAANFKVMVNANLGKKKFFKRVERGRYTAA
ncbi:MAG: hypothetical protein IT436_14125 [Phycisphaerales bacterium]|nr:hypothetical protein [Phycisphaerales bacterium]